MGLSWYLLAVAASEFVFPSNRTITSTMSNSFAVDTFDFDFLRVLRSFFGATAGKMPKL
jgi:hypothetical protein